MAKFPYIVLLGKGSRDILDQDAELEVVIAKNLALKIHATMQNGRPVVVITETRDGIPYVIEKNLNHIIVTSA